MSSPTTTNVPLRIDAALQTNVSSQRAYDEGNGSQLHLQIELAPAFDNQTNNSKSRNAEPHQISVGVTALESMQSALTRNKESELN